MKNGNRSLALSCLLRLEHFFTSLSAHSIKFCERWRILINPAADSQSMRVTPKRGNLATSKYVITMCKMSEHNLFYLVFCAAIAHGAHRHSFSSKVQDVFATIFEEKITQKFMSLTTRKEDEHRVTVSKTFLSSIKRGLIKKGYGLHIFSSSKKCCNTLWHDD